MTNNDRCDDQTAETAWRVTGVSAMLVLATAMGILASIKAFLFYLSRQSGVLGFLGTGLLLLVTLANAIPVFLVTLLWLWSFRPRTLFGKVHANRHNVCFVMTTVGSQPPI